jgi:hypothetical protein
MLEIVDFRSFICPDKNWLILPDLRTEFLETSLVTLSVTDPAIEHFLPKNYKEFDELQKVTRMLRATSLAQILLRHGGRSMASSFCK